MQARSHVSTLIFSAVMHLILFSFPRLLWIMTNNLANYYMYNYITLCRPITINKLLFYLQKIHIYLKKFTNNAQKHKE